MNAADFYDLVSGRRRGITAAATRAALACGEVPYAAAVAARNRWYDFRSAAAQRVAAPVVSVGNLTVGGTGKTPMVKALVRWFQQRSLKVVILSRGYGADASGANDEAKELAQSLPGTQHLQNKDRVAAARQAIQQLDAEVLVLDDGFQHRRLARDLDIVLLDATAPFGYERLLPRGALREPIASLKRAHIVCLTRAHSATEAERANIRQRVARVAPQAVWCESTHAPRGLLEASGEQRPIEALDGQRVAAFCGIGNPAAFRKTLESAGAEIVAWNEAPDHHRYNADDIAQLEQIVASSGAEQVVCTHKDLVKIPRPTLADRPLAAVVVEIEFLAGQEEFDRQLSRILPTGAHRESQ